MISSFFQQYLINMFYEILNLRAPNVSTFAEALKVADPCTFKDSFLTKCGTGHSSSSTKWSVKGSRWIFLAEEGEGS